MPLPCATSLSRVASASASAMDKPAAPKQSARTRMFSLFVLIVLCCTVGLVSVASLIQQRDLQLHHVGLRSAVHAENEAGRGPSASASAAAPSAAAAVRADEWTDAPVDRSALDHYECLGWVAQRDCDPMGGADAANDRACNATVRAGESGFCALRDARTGRVHRAVRLHCDSLRADVRFSCQEFPQLLGFGPAAAAFAHDAAFAPADGRAQLADDQHTVGVALQFVDEDGRADADADADADVDVHMDAAVPVHTAPTDFTRGVAFVVYDKLLESVFASVRALRAHGCRLPVELWYKPSETNVAHPLLQALTSRHGCFLREIRDPRAAKFYTKMYAAFYSAFDQLLLLDSDNFAARDPTYLFDTKEFKTTGAIFWPDFWRPKKTIFNIQPTSFVWEALNLPFVDMFEQESGQVMVDRVKHLQGALQTLMYYAFHAEPVERLRLVWGDKDLFRFSWMQRNASFHMIATPPGSAGLKLPDQNIFCGVTMVQHDPQGEIVFLHRNQEKLSRDNRALVWHDVQQFRMGEVPIDDYDVRGANGGRYYPQYKRCYGKDIYYEKAFTVTPVQELPFADLEPMLLDFVAEAADIVDAWRARVGSDGGDQATGDDQQQ